MCLLGIDIYVFIRDSYLWKEMEQSRIHEAKGDTEMCYRSNKASFSSSSCFRSVSFLEGVF